LDALSKSHPYNPLWAQLGELYGALGFPLKVAKTIVTSGAKKVELLNRILSSLTYFIRCSEVEKRVIERQDSTEEQFGDLSAATSWQSSSSSRTTLLNEDSQPSHSSFTRRFLSSHDVMTVFDNRVDHGVEIGRELQAENCVCPFPDKCSNNNMRTKSSPLHFKAIKDDCSSVQNVCGNKEHDCSSAPKSVPLDQLNVRNESVSDVREDVHLLVPPVGGMRRTASFMKRLDNTTTTVELENSDPKSSAGTGRLYPSLADLKLVDDETGDSNFSLCPDNEPNVADLERVELNNVKSDFSFQHEDISLKVSRLCRVPTSAILYHLQNEDNGKDSKVEEVLLPKRVESERQRSSPKTAPVFKAKPSEILENSKNSLSCIVSCEKISVKNVSEDDDGRSGKGDVIFVIGDNEQLIDIKQSHKSETEHIEKAVSNNKKSLGHDVCDDYPTVLRTSSLHASPLICEHEFDLAKKFQLDINVGSGKCEFQEETINVPTREQRTKQCTTCSTSKSGYRVITVRPSVIELEDECGGLKTDLSVKNYVRTSRPVSRSLSLLSPLSGEKVGKNTSSLCRRHSDCVCDISRYLKAYHSVRFHFERCEGVLMNYIEGRDQKKSLHQTDEKTDKVAEARGNFCLSESSTVCENYSSINKDTFSVGCRTMMVKSLLDKTNDNCDMSVTRGHKYPCCINGYVGEGNAIFDDYSNLSDDDVLCDIRTSSRKAEEDGITSAEQQQCESLLELPMPRLVQSLNQV
jgi:hypothetical protein